MSTTLVIPSAQICKIVVSRDIVLGLTWALLLSSPFGYAVKRILSPDILSGMTWALLLSMPFEYAVKGVIPSDNTQGCKHRNANIESLSIYCNAFLNTDLDLYRKLGLKPLRLTASALLSAPSTSDKAL